jgi:MFS family permease
MPILTTVIRARAPLAAFSAMGILWGSFAADVPDIQRMLGVPEQQLGLLLFATPIAAVVAMLLAPRFGAAFGRWALPMAALLMCAAFILPGQMTVPWLFAVAMLGCGAGTGLTDVLMNARVAALEQKHAAPLMNLCHAGYSFGLGFGAIVTGALRSQALMPSAVLGIMALTAMAIALLTVEKDGTITGLQRPQGQGAARLGWVPLIGGAIVMIAFMTENAAENWSALHIERTLGGSPSAGAMGPALMAITMGVARLFGQGLAHRITPKVMLTWGAIISALGVSLAAAATSAPMAYAGFVIMGIGSSVIAPTAFSLVGQLADPKAQARAIARATLFGYFGYFFGPPMIGFLAGVFGLRAAFVFAAVLLAIVPLLARAILRAK